MIGFEQISIGIGIDSTRWDIMRKNPKMMNYLMHRLNHPQRDVTLIISLTRMTRRTMEEAIQY